MAEVTTILIQDSVNMPVSAISLKPSQSDIVLPPEDENAHEHDDPEDVLFDSLQTLYDYQPVAFTSAGASYTYTYPKATPANPIKITLQTPDTDSANWSLHASSVWIASIQLASGVDFLRIDHHLRQIRPVNEAKRWDKRRLRILELGASAGLPSILITKLYPDVSIVVTDYPDPQIIRTLTRNIQHNGAGPNCCAAPYGWGTDPGHLFSLNSSDGPQSGFDIVIAADTLWNPDTHSIFVDTLQRTLRKDPDSRVHLVAGLHTGRFTIDSFLRRSVEAGFFILEVVEREVIAGGIGENTGAQTRAWDVTRSEYEEEKGRRGWVIWVELCWEASRLS